MPVVSNTSPVLNLAIIDRLELLRRQFVDVLIPPAVLAELMADSELPGADTIRQALQAGWLRVAELRDARVAQTLALELDQGEAAAIALALELTVEIIVLDERDGRAKAKALGLQPIGLLGVLLRAKRDQQLDSVEGAMQALRRDAGFFIDDELAAAVLGEAGEGS
jgi:predicted nucleic acid-binding protein